VKHGSRVNTVIRPLAGQPRNCGKFLGGTRDFLPYQKHLEGLWGHSDSHSMDMGTSGWGMKVKP